MTASRPTTPPLRRRILTGLVALVAAITASLIVLVDQLETVVARLEEWLTRLEAVSSGDDLSPE